MQAYARMQMKVFVAGSQSVFLLSSIHADGQHVQRDVSQALCKWG